MDKLKIHLKINETKKTIARLKTMLEKKKCLKKY